LCCCNHYDQYNKLICYRKWFSRKTTLTERMIFGQADGIMFVEVELANKQVEQQLIDF